MEPWDLGLLRSTPTIIVVTIIVILCLISPILTILSIVVVLLKSLDLRVLLLFTPPRSMSWLSLLASRLDAFWHRYDSVSQ